MNYCLDTNIIIAFLRDEQKIVSAIQENFSRSIFCVTPITLCELYFGAYLSSHVIEEIEKVDLLLNTLSIIEFTSEACRDFGETSVRLQKQGEMVEDSDVMIASIAKAHGCTFVTRNKKHF